jgi:hypothetical protein
MSNLATLRHATPSADEVQRQAELEELRKALSARERGDHVEARQHMQRLSELHAQRPAEMVERMEREMGLL